jgi:hypothetical protein
MANLEIIICKSGREGGCGFENANPEDVSEYEEKQLKLGNIVVDRTFCNQQMCGPKNANIDSIEKLDRLDIKSVTGILVSGTTKTGLEYKKSPGVILKTPDGILKSEMF